MWHGVVHITLTTDTGQYNYARALGMIHFHFHLTHLRFDFCSAFISSTVHENA